MGIDDNVRKVGKELKAKTGDVTRLPTDKDAAKAKRLEAGAERGRADKAADKAARKSKQE